MVWVQSIQNGNSVQGVQDENNVFEMEHNHEQQVPEDGRSINNETHAEKTQKKRVKCKLYLVFSKLGKKNWFTFYFFTSVKLTI